MEIMDDHAPGRKVMRRPGGRRDVYWVASPAAVRAGYRPKTVPLRQDGGNVEAPPEVAAFCRRLWAEMLEFMAGAERGAGRFSLGTVGWASDLYASDPDSRYRNLRPVTREGYDKSLRIIKDTVGARRLDTVTSSDLRRWHAQWGRADKEGVIQNPRRAYGCVQVLRIVVKHGAGLRNAPCRELSHILTDTEFSAPRGRRQAMSSEQVTTTITKARELGEPGVALALALQWCCALRQKDVIGEWNRQGTGKRAWGSGLLWGEHIRRDWRLEKPTSKSNFKEIAEFDLRLLPIVMAELERVSPTSRIGPVVLDHRTGRPFLQREFARRFRVVARAAGVPDDVWNMDARAGAITDAYDHGARETDAMDTATHRHLSTNLRYKRAREAATSRVSVLRFGDKNDA